MRSVFVTRFTTHSPKGKRVVRPCRLCSSQNRKLIDLGILSGYWRPTGAGEHIPHLAAQLAEAAGVQDGTYAEQLIAEFDDMVAELKEIIREARERRDHKLAFEAMRTRGDVLIAKGRALGLGTAAAAKRSGAAPPDPGRVMRQDVAKLVESFQRTTKQQTGDEAGMSDGDTGDTSNAG